MDTQKLNITREKHSDHMVRIVPFITFLYGIQSYILFSINPSKQTGQLIFVMGISLGLSVLCLLFYDIKHHVEVAQDHLLISWAGLTQGKKVLFSTITKIDVSGEEGEFNNVTLTLLGNKKIMIYFIDQGHELKKRVTLSQSGSSNIQKAA